MLAVIQWGTIAAVAFMGATAAAIYKLLGMALPRIGRSVMAEEIDRAIKPLRKEIGSFATQLTALDGKVSTHLLDEADDVKGIRTELQRQNDAHDKEHDRMYGRITTVEGDVRRVEEDIRRRP